MSFLSSREVEKGIPGGGGGCLSIQKEGGMGGGGLQKGA